MPWLLACWRVYDTLPSSVGNCADLVTPSCARDCASRAPAICTSRFSAATRRSSSVSFGSPNSAHQSTSIVVGSVVLAVRAEAFITCSCGPDSHDSGAAHLGFSKFGPTVQPPSAHNASVAVVARKRTRSSGAGRNLDTISLHIQTSPTPHFTPVRAHSGRASPAGHVTQSAPHPLGTSPSRHLTRSGHFTRGRTLATLCARRRSQCPGAAPFGIFGSSSTAGQTSNASTPNMRKMSR